MRTRTAIVTLALAIPLVLSACGQSASRQAAGVEDSSAIISSAGGAADSAASADAGVEEGSASTSGQSVDREGADQAGAAMAQASTAACNDGANWMGCRWPAGADNVALTDIWMPGAHDSATYGISANSEFAHNCGSMPAAIPASIAAKWAKTQRVSTGKQAEGGSRYFDIRPFIWRDNTLSTCHTLVGASMDQALSKFGGGLAAFAKAHPNEAFLVDFNGVFADTGSPTSAEHVQVIRDWVDRRLGDIAFVPGTDGKTRVADVTLADMRAAGRNVIVLAPTDFVGGGSSIWNRYDNEYSCWTDDSDAAKVAWGHSTPYATGAAYQARELACLNAATDPNKLNILNFIIDSGCPNGAVDCYGQYATGDGTIRWTEAGLDPAIPAFAQSVSKVRPAIIMRDLAESPTNSAIWELNRPKKGQ